MAPSPRIPGSSPQDLPSSGQDEPPYPLLSSMRRIDASRRSTYSRTRSVLRSHQSSADARLSRSMSSFSFSTRARVSSSSVACVPDPVLP